MKGFLKGKGKCIWNATIGGSVPLKNKSKFAAQKEAKKNEELSLEAIFNGLSSYVKESMGQCNSAKDIWLKVHKVYKDKEDNYIKDNEGKDSPKYYDDNTPSEVKCSLTNEEEDIVEVCVDEEEELLKFNEKVLFELGDVRMEIGHYSILTLVHLGQISTTRSMQLPLYIVVRMTNKRTPSNVVSHDVSFPTKEISSLLRRFMRTRVISDLTFQTPDLTSLLPPPRRRSCHVLVVALATSQTSLLPPPKRRSCHLLDVALATSQTSLLPPLGRRSCHLLKTTSWRWQERRLGGGKSDVLEVARATFGRWQERRPRSNVWEVARATSGRWQERCPGGGKRNVMMYQLRRGCYGSDTPRRRNSDCVVGI
jgi:hypothetical protein